MFIISYLFFTHMTFINKNCLCKMLYLITFLPRSHILCFNNYLFKKKLVSKVNQKFYTYATKVSVTDTHKKF